MCKVVPYSREEQKCNNLVFIDKLHKLIAWSFKCFKFKHLIAKMTLELSFLPQYLTNYDESWKLFLDMNTMGCVSIILSMLYIDTIRNNDKNNCYFEQKNCNALLDLLQLNFF